MAQTVIKRIVVKLQADAKQFRKQMDGAVKTVKNAGARMRAAGSTLSMGVTLPLAAAGGAALKFAADAEEMESKLGTVFGAASSDVRAWSKTYASSVNRGVTETRKMVSDAGDLFAGLGLTKDQTLEMSKAMVTLTNDLSSFKNVEAEQAFDALRGAAVGENEALKTLGVVLNAEMVNERALAVARAEGAETLTTAHKATAAFALIQEKAANAVGDAAKTSGSFTNKLRGVQGRAKDAGVKIGTMLLPAATELLGMVEGLIDKISTINPQILKWGLLAAGVAAVLGPLLIVAGGLATAMGILAGAAMAVVSPFGLLAAAILAVGAVAWVWRDEIMEAVKPVADVLFEIPGKLRKFWSDYWADALKDGKAALEKIASLFVWLKDRVAAVFGTIGGAMSAVWAAMKGDFSAWGDFDFAATWEAELAEAEAASRAQTAAISGYLKTLGKLAKDAGGAAADGMAGIWESFSNLSTETKDRLMDDWEAFKEWAQQQALKVPGMAPPVGGDTGDGKGEGGDGSGGGGGGFREQASAFVAKVKEDADAAKSATDLATQGVNGIGDALTNAITEGKNFGKAMKALFADLVKQIMQAIVKQTLLNSLFGATGSGGIIGGVFSMGGQAAGGPVSAGVSYVTGERGLEVFTPDRAGHITSASKLAAALSNSGGGGGTTVNVEVNNNASGATARVDQSDPNRLRVIVEDIAAESIARRGKVYSALRASTGMRSQPMGR